MSTNDSTILRSKLSPSKLELLEQRLQNAKQRREQSESSPVQRIPQRPDKGPAPLSFAQQRLWFFDQLMPGSAMYNVPLALRLTGRLDRDAFGRTISELLRRHEALRTTFASVDGQPVQIVNPPQPLDLPFTDLRELGEEERERQAQRAISEDAMRPFDLSTGPLLRVSLIQLEEEEYVVLFTLHHIVSDGWSLGVFVREIVTLYKAYMEGKPSPLPELKVQYADYAVWQREWLQGEVLEQHVAFWREQLAGAPPVLELPTDHARPATRTQRGAHHTFVLPAELTSRLRELSRDEGGSLFMTLLAGWQLLLSRYSGQEDVVVGTPIANRHRAEVEPLIGFLVNTLALRARVSGGMSFRELLAQVREVTLGAYAHQDLPFEKLVEELQPERRLSHTPLFQVMFALQNAPIGELNLPGLQLRPAGRGGEDRSHYDLALSIGESGGELKCSLGYSADLFEAGTAERLALHYGRLLGEAVAAPDRFVSELEMLTAAELEQLAAWNDTTRDYPRAGLAHERFARCAAERPGQVALTDAGASLSYGELESSADRLAHLLVERGVRPGARVGVLMERSAESVVALLAIWKAGGVYLPLDPTHPAARLSFVLGDALPQVLITRGRLPEGVEVGGAQLIDLDAEREQLAAQPSHGVGIALGEAEVAYVIYTSGSTGEPKGVEVEHRQLLNTLDSTQEIYRFTSQDVVPCFAPLTFDISLFEVLSPLLAGGRLVLVDPRRALEADAVEALLGEVTFWHSSTGIMRRMLEVVTSPSGDGVRGDYGQLRGLFVGGDAVAPELVRGMRDSFPDAEAWVGYGPTEAAIICAACRVEDGQEVKQQLVGRPIGNVSLRLLDAAGREVPAGVVGEIHIGGAGVARGYLNREELTRERFVTLSGERYYKSGDLGRWLANGIIEFAGRADEQVKVRGYRVETGEVEAALVGHAGVKQAVVVARGDGSGEKRLVAYYVAEEGAGAPTAGSLREHARGVLPEYMVPSIFVLLDAMPLTALGKVDRKALPAPEGTAAREVEYVAPRTATEEMLAGIWGNLLGVERVGIADNFFELGGHSLLATQLMSRVREAFSVEVPLRQLFEQPTLGGLALAVEEAVLRGAGVSAPPIVAVSREGGSPVSFAQQRLWFIDQMSPGTPMYNLPIAVRLTGRLDLDAMQQTLDEVVRRHEALRTTFTSVDGQPAQVVQPHAPVALSLVDLRALPADARRAESERLAEEDGRRSFSLSQGPLLRATLLRLGAEEHVVLFNTHHIVSDGWSMGVLIKEIAALYKAYLEGRPSPLPELKVQYADYAAWQREWLQGEVLEQQVGYWREQLEGAPPVLELPTDRPRGAMQKHRGGRHPFVLSAELSEGLKELSRREGVTLFMTLLAGWQLLLSRYSGQDDVVVGSPIANRNHSEVEPLIGFFVNTLALRAQLDGEMSFRGLLAQVKEVTLGAYAHQDLPFEKLVEELQPERSLSHTPLFQVLFVLQNAPSGALELPGLTLSPVQREIEKAMLDLLLNMQEAGPVLNGSLIYDADLFDAPTVARMVAHFRTLLKNIIADPGRRLSELPLMDQAEERLLIEQGEGTRGDYPRESCVHELFEECAASTPDAVAVEWGGERLAYGELDERANRLARHLVSLGVGAETPVALCLERSADLVVAMLATLKAGGAYVPLDPAYPSERLALMLSDSGAPVVVTREEWLGSLSSPRGRVVCLDADSDEIALHEAASLGRRASADNLAYVIYTSGSTGEPKGVCVTHRGVARLVRGADYVRLGAGEALLGYAPATFDAATFEVWGALANGARLVLAPAGAATLEELGAVIRGGGVTTAWLTAGLFHLAVDERVEALRGVRQLLAGGDVLSARHVRRALEELEGCEVINGYGPTENTTFTCCYRVSEAGALGEGVPIGRPISNTRVYLLDSGMRPVPVGVAGELYTGGDGLARGYLSRPEQTAERFVPDPFGEAGGRLYRTGDLARWRPDGQIEFIGRADGQVKVRGFRIEVGEVEVALGRHQGVRECAVVARSEGEGEKRLVAYFVAEEGQGPTAAELREHLQQRLPAYMLPSAYVELEELPLTQNGKVDRKALPAPEDVGAAPEAEYLPPRTATEEMLAGLWSDLLGAERVGIADNFFELGGHSLLATQLMSRVREAFGVEVPLRALFAHPTVGELALTIEEEVRRGAGVSAPPIVPVSREDALPVSFAQQRLWFIDQLQPNVPLYNMPFPARLKGELDVEALQQTLDEMVRRHEALRTTFAAVDGQPTQVIHPPAPVPLPFTDLSELPDEEREREAQRAAHEEARRPFDLSKGPLLRVMLVRLAPDEHVALFTMHHIISDGWSMGVLVKEIVALYTAYLEGKLSPLPELKVQYADYAAWQHGWLQGEVLEQQVGYWREQLAGAPPVLELPTDRPRPAVRTHKGDHFAFTLPEELTRRVQGLSRREGVSLFMTLLAGWQLLLSRYSGQGDVVVGTPIANRNRSEIEPLIGFFVNTLALRARVDARQSFRELLAQVREVTLGAYAHQDLPFEKLVEELQPDRQLSHTPLFQVMFALQNAPGGELKLPGLQLQPMGGGGGGVERSLFDLLMNVMEVDGKLRCVLGYSTDLFEVETMRRLGTHYARLLEEVVAAPERALDELEMLSEEERAQLVAWNDTATEYPRAHCVHELFEAQVERTPDAVAVSFGEVRVTYRELNTRANQLARHLRLRGVGPEVSVGIMLERSIEMVVGMLGILKAGGVYVPLDPTYPKQRLAFMLEDTSARVLLTRQAFVDSVEVPATDLIDLDTDWQAVARESGDDLPPAATSDNLAYVIYTSGSTGTPKGVAVTHRNISRLVLNTDYVALDSSDAVAHVSNVSFDAATFEVWGALLNGAQLVIIDRETALSPRQFAGELGERGVSTMFLTTALFNQMAGEGAEGLRGLRHVLFGGEAVDAGRVREYLAGGESGRLLHVYGPTENTTFTTWQLVTEVKEGAHTVTIGRPIANTTVYLLDARMRLVPVGLVGEVYTGGEGLARGYSNRPELTAERFVPHPYSKEPGARLYRTGDLARLLPDGQIEFLGRSDEQIKLRGHRIELGEVEAALRQHPQLKEVVVVAREDAPGQRRLVAYLVTTDGVAVTVSEWRQHLAERLPDYMIPSAFVRLDELPLTQNGKVDRKALPAPEGAAASEAEYIAPRTATEEMLAGLWGDLLGVERVGIADNFFELGGHSLLATQLMSRVREAFSVEVPLRQLFERPTLGGLGLAVEEAVLRGAGVSAPPIVAVSREERLPVSFAQQRLWFFDQLQPNSPVYNMPMAVRLTGRLELDAMRQTLDEVVRRHEALRTTFLAVDGQPTQVIHPPQPLDLPLTDLSELPDEEREREAERAAREDAMRPFDLSAGPLLRVTLMRLAPEEHVVLFNMHHIVSDGWSMGVLVKEIAALYGSYVEGNPSPLPELKVQYADYAAWQHGWLQGEVLEQQVGYWREQLAGAPPVLELPTDRPRPATRTHRGAHHAFTLPEELTRQIQGLSRREGVSLFMTLLAGWQLLLSRYSGQGDVVVGTPIANRNRAEVEPLIGFFVNTLALRARVDGGMSFRELLAQVREVTLGAYAHQDLPFEKLVEELQPERRLSHTPLFQVMFALQNAPGGELKLPGLQLQPVGRGGGEERSLFDMSLNVMEVEGKLRCVLGYSTDLFEPATAERLALHYGRLLEGIVSTPDRIVSELEMLSEEERAQLNEWGRCERVYPREGRAHELFSRRALERSGESALTDGTSSFTYGELDAASNRLARLLVGRGLRPGSRVGVLLNRSAESVVALLAIWKAGGVYLPLDLTHPAARLSFMLGDARPEQLIVRGGLPEGVEAAGATVIDLDAEQEQLEAQPSDAIGVAADERGTAYVIYTSGSTGEPKGVEVGHDQLLNTLDGTQEHFRFTERDVVPCLAPLTFDISLFELLCPLLAGARVRLVEPRAALEADAVRELFSEVTFCHAVPGLMRRILEVVGERKDEGGHGGDYSQVRALFVGGDAVSPELLRQMRESFPAAKVLVGYGPTEATIICAAYWVEAGEEVLHHLVGRPMGNVSLRLLDSARREVPVGAVGEIYIGGAGVALGYLNREELTRERFVELEGERYYKSGDLGRWLSTGVIEFAGRADEQVKVRGFRVEIGEVEAALVGHAGVKQAVVVARGDASGEKRLVAYYVAEEGAEAPTAGDLREHVRGLLPEYMVPSVFVPLDAMPLTQNSKVDHKALPAPEDVGAAREAEYIAPRTAAEEMLAGIWGELLNVEQVGVADNFFELGGHSLLATQLMSRVREAFSVEVPLRQLFERPTLGGLGLAVEEAVLRGAGVSAPPIVVVGREERLPVSFAQQRLWFFDQLQPKSAVYNMPMAVRLTGRLDIEAMGETLTEVVRRHEALRTTFVPVDGEPVQVIAPARPLAMPLVDLSALSEVVREAEINRLAAVASRQPFDLKQSPLLRVVLLRVKEDDHVVLLTLHHISSDAWSMGVMIKEIVALYGAFREGRPSPLPELALQYADFAHWQRGWLQGEVLDAQMAFWREQLAGAPVALELPTDRPRPSIQTHSGAHLPLALPEKLVESLKALGRREGVTLFMTLLAAWQSLLSRYSGQEDVVVGTPIANRNRAEVEPLIGFFVNTLALRARVGGGMSFRELLAQVREVCLGAYAHQDLPFEKLVEELQPERSLSHTPIFQVMFALQNTATGSGTGRSLELPGLSVKPLKGGNSNAMFDLTLNLTEQGSRLGGTINYNTDLFDEGTIRQMAGHFERLLELAAASPDAPLRALRMLSDAERQALLGEWSTAKAEYPSEVCAHQLFERQVERTPEATAVVFGEEELSYRELNERANQLAHHLRGLGVGPESLVGLLTERSVEMLVGLLGVLKAGGAYLPLDAQHPPERLQYMMEDAGVGLLLAQRQLLNSAPQTRATEVCIDADWEEIARRGTENPANLTTPDGLAYVIYTSGSTGTPKGVMIQHRGLCNLMESQARAFGVDAGSRVLQFAAFGFDGSVSEIFTALHVGATLYLAPQHALLPGPAAGRAHAPPRHQRRHAAAFVPLRDAGRRLPRLADARRGRRSLPGRPRGAVGQGAAVHQRLRPDGDDGLRDPRGVRRRRPHAAHRSAAGQRRSLHPRRRVGRGSGGGEGRAVRRRRGRGARVSESAGSDGRTFHPEPVLGRAGRAPLSHGRPGPLPARRPARLPRAQRPSGEAARLPHRAWRGGRAARVASFGARGGRAGQGGSAG